MLVFMYIHVCLGVCYISMHACMCVYACVNNRVQKIVMELELELGSEPAWESRVLHIRIPHHVPNKSDHGEHAEKSKKHFLIDNFKKKYRSTRSTHLFHLPVLSYDTLTL